MLEVPHHLEFSEDSLGADETLEHVGKLLEGDAFAVSGVGDGPHDAEGAVPDGTVSLVLVSIACIESCGNEYHVKEKSC